MHTFNPPSTSLVDEPVDLDGFNLIAQWRRTISPGSNLSVKGYVDHTYRLGTDFGERRTTLDVDGSTSGSRRPARHHLGRRRADQPEPHHPDLRILRLHPPRAHAEPAQCLRAGRVHAGATPPQPHRRAEARTQHLLRETPPARADECCGHQRTVNRCGVESRAGCGRRPGWTRTSRSPSRSPPECMACSEGNPDLEPESTIGFEAGYRALLMPAFYVDVTGFRNRHEDVVDTDRSHPETRITEGLTLHRLAIPWANDIDGTPAASKSHRTGKSAAASRARQLLVSEFVATRGGPACHNLASDLRGSPGHHRDGRGTRDAAAADRGGSGLSIVSPREGQGIRAYHAFDLRLAVPLAAASPRGRRSQPFDAHHPEWAARSASRRRDPSQCLRPPHLAGELRLLADRQHTLHPERVVAGERADELVLARLRGTVNVTSTVSAGPASGDIARTLSFCAGGMKSVSRLVCPAFTNAAALVPGPRAGRSCAPSASLGSVEVDSSTTRRSHPVSR